MPGASNSMNMMRRFRYRAMRSDWRLPLMWLRHLGLDPADVFIASFPRAGQHWLRFQLMEILTGELPAFRDGSASRQKAVERLDMVFPKIGQHVKGSAALPGQGRLIQTHERYRREYKKAIYLVRDVRDVVLSVYAKDKRTSLPYTHSFEDYVAAFLEGKLEGFGSWHRHVESWLESPLAQEGKLLVVRYEDMRANTEDQVARIVEFLGFEVDRQVIREAVEHNAIENSNDAVSSQLPTTAGGESAFVRGSVGAWRERLSEGQIQAIHHVAGPTLVRVGYAV